MSAGAVAKTSGGEELVLVPAWLAISLLAAYVVLGSLLFRRDPFHENELILGRKSAI